jgi:hypothetical protein
MDFALQQPAPPGILFRRCNEPKVHPWRASCPCGTWPEKKQRCTHWFEDGLPTKARKRSPTGPFYHDTEQDEAQIAIEAAPARWSAQRFFLDQGQHDMLIRCAA